LAEGGRYTLLVDSTWRDALGRELGKSFRRDIVVGAAYRQKIDTTRWVLHSPVKGSRNPLVIEFPIPLDHGLLLRSLGVEDARGRTVAGEGSVAPGEKAWQFTPGNEWSSGDYNLVVLSILEDGAGNRIDRAFEVDMFTSIDSVAAPERYSITFRIR
jgi:hypothetical protein